MNKVFVFLLFLIPYVAVSQGNDRVISGSGSSESQTISQEGNQVTLSQDGGTVTLPFQAPRVKTLFAIWGQSNAVGRALISPGSNEAQVIPEINIWDGSEFVDMPAQHTSGTNPNTNPNQHGIEKVLNKYKIYWPEKELYLVKYGDGGRRLYELDSGGDQHFNLSVSRLNAAINNLIDQNFSVRLVVLWIQGEADGNNLPLPDTYGDRLVQYIDKLREIYGQDLYFTSVSILERQGLISGKKKVNRHLQNLPIDNYNHLNVVDADDVGDNLHYSTVGFDTIAVRFLQDWYSEGHPGQMITKAIEAADTLSIDAVCQAQINQVKHGVSDIELTFTLTKNANQQKVSICYTEDLVQGQIGYEIRISDANVQLIRNNANGTVDVLGTLSRAHIIGDEYTYKIAYNNSNSTLECGQVISGVYSPEITATSTTINQGSAFTNTCIYDVEITANLPFNRGVESQDNIYDNGKFLGLNVPLPTANLDVDGTLRFRGLSNIVGTNIGVDGNGNLGLVPVPISGTAQRLAKFNGTGGGIENSLLFDNGTQVGINTISPGATLDVAGTIQSTVSGNSSQLNGNTIEFNGLTNIISAPTTSARILYRSNLEHRFQYGNSSATAAIIFQDPELGLTVQLPDVANSPKFNVGTLNTGNLGTFSIRTSDDGLPSDQAMYLAYDAWYDPTVGFWRAGQTSHQSQWLLDMSQQSGFSLRTAVTVGTGARRITWKKVISTDPSGDRVAIGVDQPNTSAALEIASTTGGLLLPRVTAAEASSIVGVNGLIIYVTTVDVVFTATGFWGFENGTWAKL